MLIVGVRAWFMVPRRIGNVHRAIDEEMNIVLAEEFQVVCACVIQDSSLSLLWPVDK